MTMFMTDAEQNSMRAYYEQSMTSAITLARWNGQPPDSYGKKIYLAPETIKARIVTTSEEVYNAEGQLTVAAAKLMLPYGTNVTVDDQITLSGKTTPAVLLSAGNEPNDSWPLCERVMLGKA